MKLLFTGKDGGPESNVTGYWLIESKRFLSIALLRFDHGTREAYHSHAFNCFSWVLSGLLVEEFADLREDTKFYRANILPFITRRNTIHRVRSVGTSWVLTFRGPWAKNWIELRPGEDKETTLTWGRKEVD